MAPENPRKASKRKAEDAERPTKKKKRSEGEPAPKPSVRADESTDPQDQILLLETSILESKKNYNNIITLLTHAQSPDDTDTAVLATIALTRVFVRLIAAGSLATKPAASEKELVVVPWLRDRLAELKTCLVRLLAVPGVGTTVLTLAMRLLREEGRNANPEAEYGFPKAFLRDVVRRLLDPEADEARQAFAEDYLRQYADVRFYAMQALRDALVSKEPGTEGFVPFDPAFSLLSLLGPPAAFAASSTTKDPDAPRFLALPAPPRKAHPLRSPIRQKKQVQGAWLALLSSGLTPEQRKRVLRIMVVAVVPWFTQSELLADFLTDSYDAGGATSLLALSGVFYLITERNLDYPSFYRKLYSLLDASVLHSKHRSRFFRLLETFLASSHLPAALVASFIKRLARLALAAPPGAVVFIVPWMYNTFRQHPLCTFMMHRETRDPAARAQLESAGLDDPFDPHEPDPMKTGAIDSCIWEVVQLQSHYHPNVATIAKIVSEQFTKTGYNLEDFLDHSYASLLEAELAKDVKKPPVVEFHIPKKIFFPGDAGSGVEDGLLAKLWGFS